MTTPAETLDQLSANLRRRTAKSPRNSRTARVALDQLAFLESPTCDLSTAEKVTQVRETIRDYRLGLNLDHSHQGPNSGPESHPLRPQRP